VVFNRCDTPVIAHASSINAVAPTAHLLRRAEARANGVVRQLQLFGQQPFVTPVSCPPTPSFFTRQQL
jgi:hypothetical protein